MTNKDDDGEIHFQSGYLNVTSLVLCERGYLAIIIVSNISSSSSSDGSCSVVRCMAGSLSHSPMSLLKIWTTNLHKKQRQHLVIV